MRHHLAGEPAMMGSPSWNDEGKSTTFLGNAIPYNMYKCSIENI
jgi:hypothetical protein